MKALIFALILGLISIATGPILKAQSETEPLLEFDHIAFLTNNYDSLANSFLRQGFVLDIFSAEPAKRECTIALDNGCFIRLIEASDDSGDWQHYAVVENGTHISQLAFRTDRMPELKSRLAGTSFIARQIADTSLAYASPGPLDVVVIAKPSVQIMTKNHPNGVYRIDWLILDAPFTVQEDLAKFFGAAGIKKRHEGCCDYWRFNPDTPTSFRFWLPAEMLTDSAKRNGIPFLSIETNSIVFAY